MPPEVTRVTLRGLTERVPVELAVVARDAVGESPRSASVIVRPALSAETLDPPDALIATRGGTAASISAGVVGHFYRRDEDKPGLFELRSGTPVATLADGGLDPCKAYVYLATAVEPATIDGVNVATGEESGVSAPMWVDRWVQARKPQWAMAQTGGPPINFRWDCWWSAPRRRATIR